MSEQNHSKRAAIYVRISGRSQEDGTSLETQEEACLHHCTKQGYLVEKTYIFREVHTGTDLWERPRLMQMLEAMRQHKVTVIVAYALDRLSRNQHHLGLLVSEAERWGVTLEFVTERLEDTATGQFLRQALGFVAAVEHEKIKERVSRGRRRRAESGKPIPSQRPLYGYQWNADKTAYIPKEPEASIVRRMFKEIAAGQSIRGLVRQFTAEGIPTPSGKQNWATTTVFNILWHPVFIGKPAAYRTQTRVRKVSDPLTGDVRISIQEFERAEEEQIPLPRHVFPSLVPHDLAEAVRERLRQNQIEAARNNHFPESALLRGGFAFCGYCGSRLHISRHEGGSYYRCAHFCQRHQMAAHIIDEIVWTRVKELLTQPDIITEELAKLRRDDPTKSDLEAIEHRIASIAQQQANLARAIGKLDDPDASAPLEAELANLAKQKRGLESEYEHVEMRRAAWEAAQTRLQDLEAWCHQVASRLGELTYQQKRMALRALDVQVRIYRQDHKPRYIIEASIPLLTGTQEEGSSQVNDYVPVDDTQWDTIGRYTSKKGCR